jgi:hypothetical protein
MMMGDFFKRMNPTSLPLLVVFFGIFHVFGGALFGQGIRALRDNRDRARFFLVSGAVFGILPIVFDYAFLMMQNAVVWGLGGPALFLFATVVSAFVWEGPFEEIDPKALLALGMGSGAVLLGIFGAMFMWNAAQQDNVGAFDYIMGGVWTCLFVGVGASFAWLGLSALMHHRTLAEENTLRARAAKGKNRKKANE